MARVHWTHRLENVQIKQTIVIRPTFFTSLLLEKDSGGSPSLGVGQWWKSVQIMQTIAYFLICISLCNLQ